jgi:hypothetical protein
VTALGDFVCKAFAGGVLSSAAFSSYGANGLFAQYSFDEAVGSAARDGSGNHHDATIINGATWTTGVSGHALLLNGANRARVPLDLSVGHQLSISVWAKGSPSPIRIAQGYRGMRPPEFQVCGELIYLVTNDDWPMAATSAEGPNASHIWTGSADVAFQNWAYTRRTEDPLGGVEPKMQFTQSGAVYQWWGHDASKQWQIWTANSEIDGSAWKAVPRTTEFETVVETNGEPRNRVESGANLQIVDKTAYLGFLHMDELNRWQMDTATVGLKGLGYTAVRRKIGPNWGPSFQIVGNKIFYLYPKGEAGNLVLHMSSSDLDGSDWMEIRELGPVTGNWWGSFQVSKGRIYAIYPRRRGQGNDVSDLYTASMDIRGSKFVEVRRAQADDRITVPIYGGIQIVGNRIYYSFNTAPLEDQLAESLWTAESNLDGSDWNALHRAVGAGSPYKGLQVIGAKEYLGLYSLNLRTGQQTEALASVGANLVSKGDAFGIGITERGFARAFVNAGQDYLFRAEAPSDVGGAIADSRIDGDGWHQLVMTYDEQSLKLYVDGELKTVEPYSNRVQENPFPLLVGDGFAGALDEVQIYDRVLSPSEVRTRYRKFGVAPLGTARERSGP